MKSLSILITIILLSITFSCADKQQPVYTETLQTKARIIEISTPGKYTRVYAEIFHHGISVEVSNGSSGYYREQYNLTLGQEIPITLEVSYYTEKCGGYKVHFSSMDLSQYEK